jgi:hypothetical protein
VKSQKTIGNNSPEDYRKPKTFHEAELRLIEIDKDVRIMEAQLSDPRMRTGKSTTEYKMWRASTIKAMAWKKREYKLTKLWISNEKERRGDMLLREIGVTDPEDPVEMLACLHGVTMALIKENDLQFVISDDVWLVVDKAKALVRGFE